MSNTSNHHDMPLLQTDLTSKHNIFSLIFRCVASPLKLVFLCCLPLLASCAVGPDFSSLEPEIPDGWTESPPLITEAVSLDDHDLSRWWTVFNDSQLTSLVERAMQANLDLKLAESRIRQARASLVMAGAHLGPEVASSASYDRNQKPVPGSDFSGSTTSLYQIGFDASWEIDLFGGVRREVEATAADLDAVTESRRDVLVSLSAEVANSYLNLRSLQQRLRIARSSLAAYEHTRELVRKRWEAGFVNKLDLVQAEAQVATTAGQIPLLESQIRQTIYGLSLLMGEKPDALLAELTPDAALPVMRANVPVGLPSEILLRRPDVRKAEANVHAATARIGVATADLFPKFNIVGNLGLQNNTLGSTFNQTSRAWSLIPSVSWPVLYMGRNRANIELKKDAQAEELLLYQQTILEAFSEVECALNAANKEEERRKALAVAVTANRTALSIAASRYSAGESDFLAVLDAQRSLSASEEQLAQSSNTVSTNLVALFKALGGGWEMTTL